MTAINAPEPTTMRHSGAADATITTDGEVKIATREVAEVSTPAHMFTAAGKA